MRNILMIMLLLISSTIAAQEEHLKIWGIPISGWKTDFEKKLNAKGLLCSDEQNDYINKQNNYGLKVYLNSGARNIPEIYEVFIEYIFPIDSNNGNEHELLFKRLSNQLTQENYSLIKTQSDLFSGAKDDVYSIYSRKDPKQKLGEISLRLDSDIDNFIVSVNYRDDINTRKYKRFVYPTFNTNVTWTDFSWWIDYNYYLSVALDEQTERLYFMITDKSSKNTNCVVLDHKDSQIALAVFTKAQPKYKKELLTKFSSDIMDIAELWTFGENDRTIYSHGKFESTCQRYINELKKKPQQSHKRLLSSKELLTALFPKLWTESDLKAMDLLPEDFFYKIVEAAGRSSSSNDEFIKSAERATNRELNIY